MTEFNNKSPQKIALAQLKSALGKIKEKHTQAQETRAKFSEQYGSIKAFMEMPGRVLDLTDIIRNEQDIENTQNPLLLSFFDLSEKLFPVEGERETRLGFQLYVQIDKYGKFPPNERRILAVVETERVVSAAVYGVCLPPESTDDTGIDGVVGITYAMVAPEYQGVGLGKSIVELVQDKATEFVSSQGIDDPKIVMGAEINEWRKMALEDLVIDVSGALTLPYGRQNFWNNCGFRPLEQLTNYAQIKLREGLTAFSALTYHIAGWEGERIPSKLAEFMIDYHSEMCLNKQQGLDGEDHAVLDDIHKVLSEKPTTPLGKPVNDHKELDTQLMQSVTMALKAGFSMDTPMPEVYKNFIGQQRKYKNRQALTQKQRDFC